MKNKKVFAYQQKQIDKLKEQTVLLNKENKILKQENDMLKKINNGHRQVIEDMKTQHMETLKKYNNSLSEINHLKSIHKEILQTAKTAKKEYSGRITALLNKLYKQTK